MRAPQPDLFRRYLNPVRDRDAWVEARKAGIGGSDAGTLMRWNQYSNVSRLWKEKAGVQEAQWDDSFNRFIHWGNMLEPVILQHYASWYGVWALARDLAGHPVLFPPRIEMSPVYLDEGDPGHWTLINLLNPVVSPLRPYARANVDGYDMGESFRLGDQAWSPERALEVKTTGASNAPKWDWEAPPTYLAQGLHNREVLRDIGHDIPFTFAALVGGNSFGRIELRDLPEYTQELVRREAHFWDCVESMTKPRVASEFPRIPSPLELLESKSMGFTPPKQRTKSNIPSAPTGAQQAKCCSVIDRGVVESEWNGELKQQHKFSVHWILKKLIPEVGSDGEPTPEQYAGQPFMVQEWFTVSLHEKSNFRKFLKGWRGRDVTEAEEAAFNQGKWDIGADLVGMDAILTVTHTVKPDGKVFADVEAASPLMEGMEPMLLPDEYRDWLPPKMRPDYDPNSTGAPKPAGNSNIAEPVEEDFPF